MIEKLITSKTRIKILRFFFSHIDDRYYLRELERLLDESLSPLRRQLMKLTGMGILITEEEANLKYYRLNKNFEGLEELKKIALNQDAFNHSPDFKPESSAGLKAGEVVKKRFRYDLAVLSFISVFVLMTAIIMVYFNDKNIKQVMNILSENKTRPAVISKNASATNGEMASRKWKVIPGNIPVLSSGETGEEKNRKKL